MVSVEADTTLIKKELSSRKPNQKDGRIITLSLPSAECPPKVSIQLTSR